MDDIERFHLEPAAHVHFLPPAEVSAGIRPVAFPKSGVVQWAKKTKQALELDPQSPGQLSTLRTHHTFGPELS